MSPPAIRFDLLTLFPGLFEGFLSESILGRAIAGGLVEVGLWDIRQWAEGRHKQVDDRPFGGGPGMVLMAPPVVAAVEAVRAKGEDPGRLIALTPQGRRLDQALVRDLAGSSRLVLLCGRYEGFDERILDVLEPELVSIGDYVLSGGEVPAMVLVDAVMRLIPGVLGDAESALDESFGPETGLEYPHYTRPREYRDRAVPEVLLNGDHAAIDRWRREQGRIRTAERRGDLVVPTATGPKTPKRAKPTGQPQADARPETDDRTPQSPPEEPGHAGAPGRTE
ncbi:tRNA (guanosine(37)-N1)-methyltransferase TrmD [Isosphaeraceae bacterium EP7]